MFNIVGCTLGFKKEAITVTPTVTEEIKGEQLVGNDEDNHGCKASTDYSWCEVKQKCLRTWEKTCEEELSKENVKEGLTKLLVEKYNW